MKQLVVLFVLVVMSATGFAQSTRSILRVQLSDNSPLTMTINNRRYNKQGTSITVGDLPKGRHYLQVYAYNAYRDKEGGYAKQLFGGNVKVQKGSYVNCTVDAKSGQMRCITQPLGEGVNTPQGGGYASTDADNTGNPRLANLKAKVDAKETDTEKLKLMKDAVSKGRYNTYDISEMMNWLNFEDSKLELAKTAYPNVTDKQQYSKLDIQFSNAEYKDAFRDFLKSAQ